MKPELERTPMPDVKNCPFCGKPPYSQNGMVECLTSYCPLDQIPVELVHWNTRPAEARLESELLSLRKSSHSVSQCCPMSERLQKRVEELEAIIASGLSGEDKAAILKLLTLTRKSSRDMTGPELKAAREAAGLTVEQASHLIAHGFCCTPASVRGFLCHWEAFDGHVSADKFSPGLWDVIDKTYGLNREAAAEASAKGVKDAN